VQGLAVEPKAFYGKVHVQRILSHSCGWTNAVDALKLGPERSFESFHNKEMINVWVVNLFSLI
jgi:hypothetical protein